MVKYRMTDVIPLLGIPGPKKQDMRSYNVACPCCDSGKSTHLNINLRKDVFRCVVCDFSGGVLDLYAYCKNIPRSEAFRAMVQELGEEKRDRCPSSRQVRPEDMEEDCPVTDIRFRHQTYTALLEWLSLSKDHLQNLQARGLPTAAIQKNKYRTTPVMGHRMMARQLQEAGCTLRGVPGFFKTKQGEWSFVRTDRGFFVPVRNVHGQIQGLQLRLDKADKRKYRWISSTDRMEGTGAKGWVHTAGPIRKRMLLIEGGLKADIVRQYTGQSLIAILGVNMITELKTVLNEYTKQGLESLRLCFDMDFLRNHHVFDAYEKMLKMLDGIGIRYMTYLWDPMYKGLDDYCKYMNEG